MHPGMPIERPMTWLLVILVIACAAGVLLAILGEGTDARRRSRER